jgi:hypothetical protein
MGNKAIVLVTLKELVERIIYNKIYGVWKRWFEEIFIGVNK